MRAYASRFYDGYFVGVEGDVAFYAARAKEADGAVLEVGCGSGRIALALAGGGAEVAGLDHDADLLALARGKAVEAGLAIEWVEGDMAEFALGRRFAQIHVPYRTFQHLLTVADQIRALHCMADHLDDDGLLLFDSFDPLGQLAAEGFTSPLYKDTDFVDPATGHQVVVYYSRAADPQTQILEQELIFEEIGADGVAVGRTFTRLLLRWSTRWELEHLLAGCGFEVMALDGDFAGGAYPGYGNQVWTARRV
ncbi:MAG: class I SAM-dependent methyltransferase [Candidatus Latescibacteria bacterium]|jgi:SAM-dependent methyltransferase|nr:class I SAM-dependent methyltransferase [Candidatus Latescibacterota bacterium]